MDCVKFPWEPKFVVYMFISSHTCDTCDHMWFFSDTSCHLATDEGFIVFTTGGQKLVSLMTSLSGNACLPDDLITVHRFCVSAVKPKPPRVWNITFSPELHHATIKIQSPYHNDYLKVENQLFQLHIWTTDHRDDKVHINSLQLTLTSDLHSFRSHCSQFFASLCSLQIQNISSMDTMTIDMEHLHSNTLYFIRVRAIPDKFFKGSWSDWSETFNFSTPGGEELSLGSAAVK